MARSTKDAWLEGPGDLKEADVEDVPVKGESVRVRGLPAAFSNQAQSEALESRQVGRDTINVINKGRMEVLQFTHGVIEPTFTAEEAQRVSEKYSVAWARVIEKIDELSAVDKEAIDEANARFQGSGADANGADVGDAAPLRSGGPDLPPRAGVGTKDAGGGDV